MSVSEERRVEIGASEDKRTHAGDTKSSQAVHTFSLNLPSCFLASDLVRLVNTTQLGDGKAAEWRLSVNISTQVEQRTGETKAARKRAPSPAVAIDVAELTEQIAFVLAFFPFQTLEGAANALAQLLLSAASVPEQHLVPVHADVELRFCACSSSGSGSGAAACAGALAPCASLRVSRDAKAAAQRMQLEHNAWGTVDVLYEDKNGLYRLNIAPGKGIPLHVHRVMNEREMVASHGLVCTGCAVPFGSVHCWGCSAHGYDNPAEGGVWRSVLCVDAPKFIPTDEVVLDAKSDEARAAPPRPAGTLAAALVWPLPQGGARFAFPGTYPGQQCSLLVADDSHAAPATTATGVAALTDTKQQRSQRQQQQPGWRAPNAVVVLAFDDEQRLLLVRHKSRGWELPGGKLERKAKLAAAAASGAAADASEHELESPAEAALREALEEAGAELDAHSLRPLAQYWLSSIGSGGSGSTGTGGAGEHVKTVFAARVARLRGDGRQLDQDTSARHLVPLAEFAGRSLADLHALPTAHWGAAPAAAAAGAAAGAATAAFSTAASDADASRPAVAAVAGAAVSSRPSEPGARGGLSALLLDNVFPIALRLAAQHLGGSSSSGGGCDALAASADLAAGKLVESSVQT